MLTFIVSLRPCLHSNCPKKTFALYHGFIYSCVPFACKHHTVYMYVYTVVATLSNTIMIAEAVTLAFLPCFESLYTVSIRFQCLYNFWMRLCRYHIYSFHLEVRFQKYTFFTVLSPVLCKQEVQTHVKVTIYY